MEYISAKEAAEKWNIHIRVVQTYCKEGRIEGARKYGVSWMIPAGAKKPVDKRRKEAGSAEKPEDPKYYPFIFVNCAYPFAISKLEGRHGNRHGCTGNVDARKVIPAGNLFETEFNDAMQAQLIAELDYLRCDYEKVLQYYETVEKTEPTYICAAAVSMTAAIALDDFKAFERISQELMKVQLTIKDSQIRQLADLAIATATVSMYAMDMVPQWLKDCQLENLPAEAKPWALYLYAKTLQLQRKDEGVLGVCQAALCLISSGKRVSSQEIYLRLTCASAYYGIGDQGKAREWLAEALDVSMPYGIASPFAETIVGYGGLLEELLQGHWPEYYDKILGQAELTWKNWIDFHNEFARSNVTRILTVQEYHLALFLAEGLTYAEAARRMKLSVGRVKNMISIIYGKLYIKNKSELKQYLSWDGE